MSNVFQLRVISSERTIFQGEVTSLIVPAEGGYLGVLAHHAPLVANLIPGKIILKDADGQEQNFRSEGKGFFEVVRNTATLLVDSLEKVQQ